MPALLLAGTRFLIAGAILLAWCRWRGLRLTWPLKTMLMLGLIGLLASGRGNVGLVYAEETVPSGLSSLVLAVIPLYVALIEACFCPVANPCRCADGWACSGLRRTGCAAMAFARTGLAATAHT